MTRPRAIKRPLLRGHQYKRLVSSCLGADGQDSWGNFAIGGVSSCPAGTVTTAGAVCLWKSIHISPRTSNTDVSLCSETRTFKRPALVGFSQLQFPNLLVATQSEQPAAAPTDGMGGVGGADYQQSEQLFNEHRDLFLRRSFPLKMVEAVSRSI